jgi:tRNA A-37 threonylcarbamoyl transferase component Bud32
MVCGKRNRGKFVMKVYDDIYREVFVDEVMYHQTAAKLGIAPAILDAYVSPGKGMIVMQEVEGARTLREYMLSKKTDAEIVDTARQIARLVDRLHRAGIYHGDLHDENVMVDRHGRVWLIDFGRAGAFDTRPDRVQKNLRQVEHDYEVLLSRKNLGNLFRYTLNKYVPKIVDEFWDEANRILDEVRIRGEIPYFSSSIYRFHGNM